MLNTILFFFSVAILFWVLRYRVHVHVTYQGHQKPIKSRSPAIARRIEPRVCGGQAGEGVQNDLKSALVNLGCAKEKARNVAQKVYSQSPEADFSVLLKQAIREAA